MWPPIPPAAPPTRPPRPEAFVSEGVVAVFYRIVRDLPANHPSQTAAGKAGTKAATLTATACIHMGGIAAVPTAEMVAGKALESTEAPGGY